MRWHEDKLRRKFPEVLERDGERGKAVWAAIADGSEVVIRGWATCFELEHALG